MSAPSTSGALKRPAADPEEAAPDAVQQQQQGSQSRYILKAGVDTSRGAMMDNEDRHTLGKDLEELGVCFAVYDGHGGDICARYVRTNLPKTLQEMYESMEDKEIRSVIETAFSETDRKYLLHQAKSHPSEGKAGCTATVCIFRGLHAGVDEHALYVANLGDSRAVLGHEGTAEALTRNHKPDLPEERERIKDTEGKVIKVRRTWRVAKSDSAGTGVQGVQLSMSRAFGHADMKQPAADPAIVSSVPDIQRYPLKDEEVYVVIASDGVFDVLSDQDVINVVGETDGEESDAAQNVVDAALSRGSQDNITAVVIHVVPEREEKATEKGKEKGKEETAGSQSHTGSASGPLGSE